MLPTLDEEAKMACFIFVYVFFQTDNSYTSWAEV